MKFLKAIIFLVLSIPYALNAIDLDNTKYYSHTGLKPSDPELEDILNRSFEAGETVFHNPNLPQSCNALIAINPNSNKLWAQTRSRNDHVLFMSQFLVCWDIAQYVKALVPEQNFLGSTPMDVDIIQELHEWFSQKFEAAGQEEYLKFNPLPDYRNYECSDSMHCKSKTNNNDLEIIEGEAPDFQTYATLLSIADINNDGFADATVLLESAVQGRVNPGEAIVYTKTSESKNAEVLKIVPAWNNFDW